MLVKKEWMEVTQTGFNLLREPTYEEWSGETEAWLALHVMNPIILGDLLNYGEARWSEEWAQVIDAYTPSYSARTLWNYKSVMKAVPPAVRQPGLRYNHYDAVRTLSTEQQAEVLKMAKEQELGTRETRVLVRKMKKDNGEPIAPIRLRVRYRCVVEEVRDDKLVHVFEDPYFLEAAQELPDGEVEVTIKETF